MVNILVGQRIKISASVWDFCGTLMNGLFINAVNINSYAQYDQNIECLKVSGIGVTFKLVGASEFNSPQCHDCTSEITYPILGVGTTNNVGVVSIDHLVTANDLSAYNDAKSKGTQLRVNACITDSKGQNVILNRCSDSLTVFQALQPTHYISLSMGFVPTELVNYFQKYIVDISETIYTKLAYPPSPWIYVKTTYDSTKNAFNIWYYLPSTMSPDTNSDLFNSTLAWAGLIVGAILAIIGIAIIASGGTLILFGIGGLYYLAAGVIILSLTLFEVITGSQKLQNTVTNQGQQLSNKNKEEEAKVVISQTWEQSSKTQADCLKRLQSYRDLHNSIIDGDINIFGKYATLATALKSEKDSFTTTANGIITKFQGTVYTVDVCNTFYSGLDAAVTASNVKINTLISQNIVPGEGYSPTCSGWGSQKDCEKAECYWYNSGCHKEPNCWIPNPIGGCILSAGMGTVIVGTIVLIAVGGTAYWLLTRHPEETRTIITSARGAVVGEAERARQAYRRIVPSPTASPKPVIRVIPTPITKPVTQYTPKTLLLPAAPKTVSGYGR